MDSNRQNRKPVFIYWGKRGGGIDLLVDTINGIAQFSTQTIFVSVSKENFIYIREQTDAVVHNYAPHFLPRKSLSVLILVIEPLLSRLRIWLFWKKCHQYIAYVVMSSPWDSKMKSHRNNEVVRIIHDSVRHPGDFWPLRKTISKWIRDNRYITLSKFVDKDLENRFHKRSIISLSLRRNSSLKMIEMKLPPEYILICGRIKTYKNLFESIDFLLNSTKLPIIIAGRMSRKFPGSTDQILFFDSWLASGELEYLIANASLLICYYSEASQSGILETGIFYGTPTLVSDVGALPEQVKDIDNSKTVPLGDSESFTIAVTALLQKVGHNNLKLPKSLRRNFADFILETHY